MNNNNNNILFIGEDDYYLGVIRGYCESTGCTVLETCSPVDLYETIQKFSPDLLILDVRATNNRMLAIVIKARDTLRIPLIGLGKPDEGVVKGFSGFVNHPADAHQLIDCLTRTLNSKAGHERRCMSRRSGNDRREKTDRRSVADLSLNFADEFERALETAIATDEQNGTLQIDDRTKELLLNGVAIHVSPKELHLIKFLAQEPGRVFSCVEIIDELWHGDPHADESDVRQYVYLLRSKIESDPKNPKIIVSVKGFGYKYVER